MVDGMTSGFTLLIIYLWRFCLLLISSYHWQKQWIRNLLHFYSYISQQLNMSCLCGIYVIWSKQVCLDKSCHMTSPQMVSHAFWCYLSSLSYQFSIFEDLGDWQPCRRSPCSLPKLPCIPLFPHFFIICSLFNISASPTIINLNIQLFLHSLKQLHVLFFSHDIFSSFPCFPNLLGDPH